MSTSERAGSAGPTPGPWRATDRRQLIPEGTARGSRIPFAIERELGNCVLPVADVCDQGDMTTANANLVAAAPDLLYALKLAREWIEEARSAGFSMRSEATRAAITAAITKAEGK